MLNLQGFIEIVPLIRNPTGEVSPIGELSEESKSFAKDKQYFGKLNNPTQLVMFSSTRDKVPVVVPAEFTDHILGITQWVYSKAVLGAFRNDEAEFLRLFLAQFQSVITSVTCGSMLGCNGNWYPRYIKWKFDVAASGVQDPTDVNNEIMMWLSDADFNLYYPGYEIVVVPPTDTVDMFMSVKSIVEENLAGFNLPDHHERVAQLADGYPYTKVVSHNYTWHDREDTTSTTQTTWSVVVYGRAGLNTTRIKDAYRDYILAHSEYSIPDWAKVFPEIFTATKFTFVPAWNIRGIPNQEEVTSQYSPALPWDFIVDAVTAHSSWTVTPTERTPATDATTFPTLYKSLAGLMIAGAENDAAYKTIHQALPNYALLNSLSPDIGWMPKATTDWLVLFYQAVIAAEDYHTYSVTTDIVRIEDEATPGRFYWTFEHKNIEYRVVGRKSI